MRVLKPQPRLADLRRESRYDPDQWATYERWVERGSRLAVIAGCLWLAWATFGMAIYCGLVPDRILAVLEAIHP